jgi:hypothetical protein
MNDVFLVAAAPAAAKWKTATSGQIRLMFTYWGKLVKKLPAALQPSGKGLTPHLIAKDAAHALKLTAQLKEFIEERYPDVEEIQNKRLGLTRWESDTADQSFWITALPEDELDEALEAGDDADVWSWNAGKDKTAPMLLWNISLSSDGLRLRVTDDEIVFVDSDKQDGDLKLSGTAKPAGKLVFADGLLVGMSTSSALSELKGVTSTKTADLQKLVAKKPIVPLKPRKTEADGGVIARVAKGTYAASHGGGGKLRWLRLVRR